MQSKIKNLKPQYFFRMFSANGIKIWFLRPVPINPIPPVSNRKGCFIRQEEFPVVHLNKNPVRRDTSERDSTIEYRRII
jgi:hypothetical protein